MDGTRKASGVLRVLCRTEELEVEFDPTCPNSKPPAQLHKLYRLGEVGVIRKGVAPRSVKGELTICDQAASIDILRCCRTSWMVNMQLSRVSGENIQFTGSAIHRQP